MAPAVRLPLIASYLVMGRRAGGYAPKARLMAARSWGLWSGVD